MRTEQLYYLCETIKAGSINAAAEKLHLTQQGLNASLKSLERELGYPLFNTSRQGIELTKQGHTVLETAEKVVDLIDSLECSLRQESLRSAIAESITIYTAPVVSEYLFPEIFKILSTNYPNMAIMVNEKMSRQAVEAVKNGVCDLAIVGFPYQLLDKLNNIDIQLDGLVFQALYQYKLSIAVSEKHPLAQYKSISVKTALQYPIVLHTFEKPEDDLNYQWLKLYGEPQIKFVTSSHDIYYNIVESGAAIGLLPNMKHGNMTIPGKKGISRIALKNDEALHTVGYLYNRKKPVTPAMQIVIDELEKFCT